MNRKKISIIIPAYNAADYISDCLDSVINQTYDNYEVIVVNDGSTDNTGDKVREYCADCPKIRLISKENGGQGTARNLAIEESKGEYILFLDADDFISPITLEYAECRLEKDGSDFVFFDWSRYDNTLKEELVVRKKPFLTKDILEGEECRELFTLRPYYTVTNLYRKRFIQDNKIRYGEGYLYEDVIFWLQVCNSADKVSVMRDAFYRIRVNNASSTQSGYLNERHISSFIKVMEESRKYTANFPDNCFNPYYEYIVNRFFIYLRDRTPENKKTEFMTQFLQEITEAEINRQEEMSEDLSMVIRCAETQDLSGLEDIARHVQQGKDDRNALREQEEKNLGRKSFSKNIKKSILEQALQMPVRLHKIYVDDSLKDIPEEQIRKIVTDAGLKCSDMQIIHGTGEEKKINLQLLGAEIVLSDISLTNHYLKKPYQKLILVPRGDDDEPVWNQKFAQRNFLISDYIYIENEKAKDTVRKFGNSHYLCDEELEEGKVYSNSFRSNKIVFYDDYNVAMKLTKGILSLEDNSDCLFLIKRKTLKSNESISELIKGKAKYIACSAMAEETELLQLLGSMHFNNAYIENSTVENCLKKQGII